MIELCKEIAAIDPKVQIETIVGKELVEKGLNLIYAVGRGGQNAPALAILKYEGKTWNCFKLIDFKEILRILKILLD